VVRRSERPRVHRLIAGVPVQLLDDLACLSVPAPTSSPAAPAPRRASGKASRKLMLNDLAVGPPVL